MDQRYAIAYTLGYSALKDSAELLTLAVGITGTIVDIRLSPRSRNPEWSKKRLSALLQARYVHVDELGNLNYQVDGPVRLKDPQAGAARVLAILEGGPAVLLCVCRSYKTCHRLEASRELEKFGVKIVHLRNALPPPESGAGG